MEDENMIGKQRYSHINVKVLKGASYLDEDASGRRQQRLCFPLTCPTTSAPSPFIQYTATALSHRQ